MPMKHFLLLLFFNLSITSLDAQNIWGTEGATWHYTLTEEYWPARPRPLLYDFTRVQLVTPKVIKGKSCHGFEVFQPDSCNPLQGTFYCYEEGRKLYYYLEDDDEFSLLYDFSLQPGDSFETKGKAGILTTHIDSLGTLLVGDTSLSIQHIHYSSENAMDYPSSLFISHQKNRIFNIEGIGNSFNFFPWWLGLCHNLRATNLRCFQNNRLSYTYEPQWEGQCDSSYFWELQNTDDVHSPKLSVFPNPATDQVQIMGRFTQDFSVQLFAITGQEQLLELHPTSDQQVSFSTEHLSTGIYVLVLRSDALQQTVRLVVE